MNKPIRLIDFNTNSFILKNSRSNDISDYSLLPLLIIHLFFNLFLKMVELNIYPFHYNFEHFFHSVKNVDVVTGLFLRNNKSKRYLTLNNVFNNDMKEVLSRLHSWLAKSHVSLLLKMTIQTTQDFLTSQRRLQREFKNTLLNHIKISISSTMITSNLCVQNTIPYTLILSHVFKNQSL